MYKALLQPFFFSRSSKHWCCPFKSSIRSFSGTAVYRIQNPTRSIMAPQVFFITGTSTGFGNELVKQCLEQGEKVVATARNSSKLKFDNTSKDNYLAVDCDVTDEKSVTHPSSGPRNFGLTQMLIARQIDQQSLRCSSQTVLPHRRRRQQRRLRPEWRIRISH